MEFFKKSVLAVLLAALIISYIPARDTSAETAPTDFVCKAAGVLACVAGGIVGNWLSEWITSKLQAWTNASGILGAISGWLGLSQTVPVNDSQISHYSIMGVVARCLARNIQNRMTCGIMATTRTSGRNGWQAFVTNWRNFKTQAQYQGENIFRSILSQTKLCPHMDRQIKTLFRASNRQSLPGQNIRVGSFDPFNERNNCTLPRNFSMSNYNSNFSGNGGWEAFARLTQPQNNYFGTLANSMTEANRQRSFEEGVNSAEVDSSGFMSRRGKNAKDNCAIWNKNPPYDCLVYQDIMTPGGSIKDSVSALIHNEINWYSNVQNLSGLITDLTGLLMRRILDLGGQRPKSAGIGNTPTTEGYPGFTDQPDPHISPAPTPVFGAGNTCLTAQWFKQGKAGGTDPTGKCTNSNCVVLNYQIQDGSTDANIYRPPQVAPLFALLGARDFDQGTRVDDCAGDGATVYGLATNVTPGQNLTLPIPVGGGGSCGGIGTVLASLPNSTTAVTVCTSGTCSDGIQNGDETGIDTGGRCTGGGGVCLGGGAARYEAQVIAAIKAAESDPTAQGSADKAGGIAFLNVVATNLVASGLQATTNVLNGNDQPNRGDLIAVWTTGDTTADRYDVISLSGVSPLINFIYGVGNPTPGFKGQIPFTVGSKTCVSPGGIIVTNAQCSDNVDNNGNGLIDAADPGCHSDGNAGNAASYTPNRNDEILYGIDLCPFVRGTGGSGCVGLITSDIADLNTIGFNDRAQSVLAPAVATGKISVDLCVDVNFGNCTPISGPVNDLSTIPSIGNNTVSSVRVRQL